MFILRLLYGAKTRNALVKTERLTPLQLFPIIAVWQPGNPAPKNQKEGKNRLREKSPPPKAGFLAACLSRLFSGFF
jgi:hypothetical protein